MVNDYQEKHDICEEFDEFEEAVQVLVDAGLVHDDRPVVLLFELRGSDVDDS